MSCFVKCQINVIVQYSSNGFAFFILIHMVFPLFHICMWILCIFLGEGVLLGLRNPNPVPDHVQLILQPYTGLHTKNPCPIDSRLATFKTVLLLLIFF